MGRLVAVESVTLDGVMQAPGRPDEDRRGGFDRGGWATPYADAAMGEAMAKGFPGTGAMLFGRRTYVDFASVWPHMPDDNAYAKVLNDTTKYVASTTMQEPPPLAKLGTPFRDVIKAVVALMQEQPKDIVVLGSGELVASLAACDLVDSYPSVDQLSETRQLAQAADAAGLDYLAIQDHAYNTEFLDVWTLIAFLAAETDRISFFPDVADLQLRPPTILAKSAASLSVLTGGRIVLGVRGGASVGGIAAMGGIRRTASEMIEFTEEALLFMRIALTGGFVELRSDQHTIEGYEAGPVPASPVPLWLGSNGPRMLAVTGRSSDGWVSPLSTYVSPATVPSRQQLIDDAARAAGRDPADVRRIYNLVGAIGPARGGPGLTGDVESWVDALTDWSVVLGLDTFIFWPMTAPLAQLEVFATKVVPGVRQRVSERRGEP